MSLGQELSSYQGVHEESNVLDEKDKEIVRLKEVHQILLEKYQELMFSASDYETRNKKLTKEINDLKLQTVLRESNSFSFDEKVQRAEVLSLRDELKTLEKKYAAKRGLEEEFRDLKRVNIELEERLTAKTKQCSSYEQELIENAKFLSVKRGSEKCENCSISNISKLKSNIQSMTKEIEDCRKTLHLREERIVHLETELRTMEESLHCGVQALAAKEQLIVQLETDLEAIKQTIVDSDRTLFVKEKQITLLENDLRVVDQKLQNSSKTLNLKGELIVQLEKQLCEVQKLNHSLEQENVKLIMDNEMERALNAKLQPVRESTLSKVPRMEFVKKEPATPSPARPSIARVSKEEQVTKESRLGQRPSLTKPATPSPARPSIARVPKEEQVTKESRLGQRPALTSTTPSPARLSITPLPKKAQVATESRLGRRQAFAKASAVMKDQCGETNSTPESEMDKPFLVESRKRQNMSRVLTRNKKKDLESVVKSPNATFVISEVEEERKGNKKGPLHNWFSARRKMDISNSNIPVSSRRTKTETVTSGHSQGDSEPRPETSTAAESKKGKRRKMNCLTLGTVVSEEESQPTSTKRCLRKRL